MGSSVIDSVENFLAEDEESPRSAPKLSSKELALENEIWKRADSIPLDHVKEASDTYLEGYLQALVDMNYYEYRVVVTVKDRQVYLSNLPYNRLLANSVKSFVEDFPGLRAVHVIKPIPDSDIVDGSVQVPAEIHVVREENPVPTKQIEGVWLPQSTVLFPPLVASPRQVTYSIAYRPFDNAISKEVIAISFGDDFPIYRWRDVWKWHGDLQVGIEGGVWAVFNRRSKNTWADLINADYYVGIPWAYAYDNWSHRFRLYHVSTHLGDEFIFKHPKFVKNKVSFEAIDFYSSYQLTEAIRLYGGVGWIFSKKNPLYTEWGTELRLLGHKNLYYGLYGQPFLAMHFHLESGKKAKNSVTYALGYEWSKLQGIGRKMRLFFQYHDGYSVDGQFSAFKANYLSLNFSYGF